MAAVMPIQEMMPGGPVMSEEDMAVMEERSRHEHELRMAKLDALGQSLAKTRAEAISARQASGIEEEWFEDEEFYQGIDDANRGEFHTWRNKPPGQAARSVEAVGTTRSTVVPNITGPYVDAAAARIADMLLPTDDRSWALKPTPIPDLDGIAKGKFKPEHLKNVARMHQGQAQRRSWAWARVGRGLVT